MNVQRVLLLWHGSTLSKMGHIWSMYKKHASEDTSIIWHCFVLYLFCSCIRATCSFMLQFFFLFRILSISWSYSSQLWLLYLIRLWNQQSSKFHAGISLSIAMNGFWNVPLGFPSRTSLWKENESFPLNEKVLRHGRKKRKTKGARQVWSHSISFHAHVDWR